MTDRPFDSLLKETVTAPRLSGSKVQTVTGQFISSLDVSHITTFFKLNRSLPAGGQARISSLYVFDALSRGAHKEATKGKRKTEAKRCLDGLEAVAESWVEGMTTTDGGGAWVEGKEKAKKIIEIWKKTETFPTVTTERLTQRLTSSTPIASGSTTPPYEPGAPPPISPALPPLESKGPVPEVPINTPNGEGPSSSRSPASSALPPDILKLLGLPDQPGPTDSSSTQPVSTAPNTGSAELAAILAKLPTAKPQSPNTAAAAANGSAAPNPLAALNLGQLAELAKVAQGIKSPPPAASNALPSFPPSHHQGFGSLPPPPPPSQGYGGGGGGHPPPAHGYGHDGDRGRRDGPVMPPGTSKNYGRVKPLRNPQAGIREPEGRAPPPSADEGYARPFSRRESEDRPPARGDAGWERERERSRSPDRRDGGWGARGRGRGRGGYGNHGSRDDDLGREPRAPVPPAPTGQPSSRPFSGSGPGPGLPAGGPAPGPTLESFDMTTFNPMDPGSWATLGEAWKRSRGTEPNQLELMGWMQEKMMGGGGGGGAAGPGMGMGMGMNGGGVTGMGMNGGGNMGMGMGMGQGGGGGWGQQGGWQGQGGGY